MARPTDAPFAVTGRDLGTKTFKIGKLPEDRWPGTAANPPIEWTMAQLVADLSARVDDLERRLANVDRWGECDHGEYRACPNCPPGPTPGKTVWVIEVADYDPYVVGVATSPDAAAELLRDRYRDYLVQWEEVKTDKYGTTVTGHFEALPGKSTEHTLTYRLIPFDLNGGVPSEASPQRTAEVAELEVSQVQNSCGCNECGRTNG